MSTALEHVRPVATPGRVGQATAVEQSRAVAEVQAQVIIAQQLPRDIERAVREMKRSCGRRTLAEKAFYRFPRAGGQVSGESIVLAKELARCWGNIDYGIAELRRDDYAGESEMMAFAWDLEANTRPRTTFIVPHVRDKKGGPERLTDARDVYENNSNMGNRRMREMIFNILPPWFIEDAKEICYATLANDDRDGATVGERAAKAVERFGKIGIRAEQLSQKLGAPQANWSAADLAQLAVIFKAIERGEATAEAEFGAAAPRVTAADITGQQDAPPPPEPAQRRPRKPKDDGGPTAAAPAGSSAQEPRSPLTQGPAPAPTAPSGDRAPLAASPGQVGAIRGHFERLGYQDNDEDRAGRLRRTAALAGRESLGSTKELSADEAARVLRQIAPVTSAQALDDLLATGEVPGGE